MTVGSQTPSSFSASSTTTPRCVLEHVCTSCAGSRTDLVRCLQHPPSDTLLIPIRIDVDVDGYRYIDSLSWNLCVDVLSLVSSICVGRRLNVD